MARILVVDESQARALDICLGLIQAGYQVAAVLPTAEDLISRIEEIKPDVILIETDSPSRDTIEHIGLLNQKMPRPVVMFANNSDSATIRAAIKAGVSAYVVDGFGIERLKPVIEVALARFEMHQTMRQQLDDVSRRLAERKIIEKAKGILMKTRGLDEEAAYAALRKLAMEKSRPMAEIAANVVEMAKLLL